MSKVPGFGDIPVLGQFFRSKSINKSNSELMVLVTVHIIDPVRAASEVPPVPKPPIPFMDNPKFDKKMPGSKDTEPQAAPSSK
jgi:Flp pilus assembly secretin CpaC